MQEKPLQYETSYTPITVRADFLASGQVIPLHYIDETGKRIEIDRISREEIHYGNRCFTCVTYKEVRKPDKNETASTLPSIVTHTVPTTFTLVLSKNNSWYLQTAKSEKKL